MVIVMAMVVGDAESHGVHGASWTQEVVCGRAWCDGDGDSTSEGEWGGMVEVSEENGSWMLDVGSAGG